MKTLIVQLGARSYPIHIGAGLLSQGMLIRERLQKERICIVTDDRVGPLYLDKLKASLKPLVVESVALPHGEENKDWEALDLIFTALLKSGYGRDSALIALGGGVVGDLTGFAAAVYQRGIPYVQVATTLLAQVDSAVGGKTAINHRYGKNMVGAFHQPLVVVSDTATLDTLDPRQLAAGLAEVIKYGLIRDIRFFEWLETNIQQLVAKDEDALDHAVVRSCEIKSAIVAKDERDEGERALLNLGHTFGHAIETALGHGEWLHGEAVAAGMAMAAALAVRQGGFKATEHRRLCRLLERAGLPIAPPAHLGAEELRKHMARDKKALGGKIRLVLPKGIGQAVLTDEFDEKALEATLDNEPL
ncbi:MAG TPA: 3-dehydroquinate synthase [Gammaproteobacteria bacterium]|nr:3-dehydroquinate synthase [Gammaproteobacteria bacterium]